MALLTAGFTFGVDQADLSVNDLGDGDAWDFVSKAADGTLGYDSTHAAIGAQSLKVATGATAQAALARWTTKWGVNNDHVDSCYLYFTGNPVGASLAFMNVFNASLVQVAAIRVTTGGKIAVIRNGGVVAGTGLVSIGLNQQIRVEWHFVHDAAAGSLEVKLFNTATNNTVSETIGPFTGIDTGTADGGIQFGIVTNTANLGPIWIDHVRAGLSAYPGPAPVGKPSGTLLGVGA